MISSLTLFQGLRVEWCKARARALRWIEEVKILEEEMRRTMEYHQWFSRRWEVYAGLTFHRQAELLEGTRAYAFRQASIRRSMAAYCERAWTFVKQWICIGRVASDLDPEPTHNASSMPSADTDDDLPSLQTVSDTDSVASLFALEVELEDVSELAMAVEDFD